MTRVFFRIEFPGGERFGPGKAAILEQVDRTGSISQAARQLKMSYRRAWLLVDSIASLFGRAAVVATPGGRRGGGAALTPLGRDLVRRYRRMQRAVERATNADRRILERQTRAGRHRSRERA